MRRACLVGCICVFAKRKSSCKKILWSSRSYQEVAMRCASLAPGWVMSCALAGVVMAHPAPLVAQEAGVGATEITVGAIGALTGPLAFIGTPGRDGLTL